MMFTSGDAESAAERREPGGTLTDRIGAGAICSAALHVAAALLIVFFLPSLLRAPAEVPQIVPIDLVRLGETTISPSSPEKAAVPQEKASETARVDSADPVPAPQTPPPAATPPKPREAADSDPLGAVTPQRKPELPRVKDGPRSRPPATAKPAPAPPVDDLAATLKSLALQQQQQAQRPSNPRQQDDPGSSNVTASSDGAPGRLPTYSVKDFIRAQIERHWMLDGGAIPSGEVVVAIHILVNRDGTVSRAEIVDEARHGNDPGYLALARSARNAAYLSSPLNLPPGRYDEVRDIVLTFNPRNALR